MSSETKQILTTDGTPLEVSLKKAERKNKIKAFLLVAPLLLFLIITYVFPIGDMLLRSVDDKMVTQMLPKTFKAMENWDGQELPEEEVFAAFHEDFIKLVEEKREGKLSTQLNYTKNGKGSFRLRANWFVEKKPSGTWQICINEIPYQIQKSKIIEKIAELISEKKLIMISDIRDESSDDIRIIIEPKSRNINHNTNHQL